MSTFCTVMENSEMHKKRLEWTIQGRQIGLIGHPPRIDILAS